MGNKGGKPRRGRPKPPPLCDATPSGFDLCAESLQQSGVGCVRLDDDGAIVNGRCFREALKAMPHLASIGPGHPLAIAPDQDSAHATGAHTTGWGSSYNAAREGFVFSNGETFGVGVDTAAADFEKAMSDAFQVALATVQETLAGIERRLELPSGWFEQNFGPLADHTQWHVKRYKPECVSEHATTTDGKKVLLPVHTDPSLISVLVHHAQGVNEGALGLEYLAEGGHGEWTEVPHHGHAVATVFTGSVLDRITGGAFPAARHRVTSRDEHASSERLATTFFWRPAPHAVLRVLLSPKLPTPGQFKEMRFGTWCTRTAKRYQKHKKPVKKPEKILEGNADAKNEKPKPKLKFNESEESKRWRRGLKPEGSHEERKGSTSATKRTKTPPPSLPISFDKKDTRLALLGGPLLAGREKYLGGALGSDGFIYAIPGFAKRVLKICPSTGGAEYVGPDFTNAPFKWLRSVTCPKSGAIYGLPCHHDAVLKIEPGVLMDDGKYYGEPTISLIGEGQFGTGEWKFHGGVLSPNDGCFYCIPQFAERVLRIDPTDDSCQLIGEKFPGRNKWYGGLLGADNRIYGVPQNATGVLRIDPRNTTKPCQLFGKFSEGGYKWHGGTVGPSGEIYGIPAHADKVLKIVPGDVPLIYEIGTEKLRTGRHRDDGKYKFLGGVLGHDDCIYFIPSDSDFVVQVDCATEKVREVGETLEDETMVQNKWQNGFVGADGTIWGIPLKGETVLTITPSDCSESGKEPVVRTVGGPFTGLNKWEGGVMSACGKMYCMPLNHKRVLEIDPARGEDGLSYLQFGGGLSVAKSTARAANAGQNHD